MRRAISADRQAIEAFLARHSDIAMFPLSNLALHGMAGGNDRAMRFWLAEDADGITDVLSMSEEGMVMPVCPTGALQGVRQALAGLPLIGVVGQADQARPVITALRLADRPTTLDHDEPHLAVNLADMVVPDGPGELVPTADAPQGMILDWIYDYDTKALNVAPDIARQRGPVTYGRLMASGQHRVLMAGDRPLAMTGFNAFLPQIVQIGGVYTPPDLRNRGHARRAVALHLVEAKARGVQRAVLFASSPAAIRAYEAIGFQRIGRWTLCLFAGKEVPA